MTTCQSITVLEAISPYPTYFLSVPRPSLIYPNLASFSSRPGPSLYVFPFPAVALIFAVPITARRAPMVSSVIYVLVSSHFFPCDGEFCFLFVYLPSLPALVRGITTYCGVSGEGKGGAPVYGCELPFLEQRQALLARRQPSCVFPTAKPVPQSAGSHSVPSRPVSFPLL